MLTNVHFLQVQNNNPFQNVILIEQALTAGRSWGCFYLQLRA
jgi:hypothetical protein